MKKNYINNIRVFKALSDENRLRILDILKTGEKCACVLLNKLDIQQSTLSHHMKILCDSGIVIGRKDGKWMHYSINKDCIQNLSVELNKLLAQKPIAKSTCLVENELRKNIHNSSEESEKQLLNNLLMEGNMDKKTKLYVLTGFLGSGKTTILLKLLEALKNKKIGIIENEFGKLGIDGTILRNDDIQMVEINRGSIFCSCLKLSFVKALAEMSNHKFEYLFVESSGLGDPSNVEEILEAVKTMVGDKYDFKGAICLIDAVNFIDQLDDLETVYRQLKHCNLAVITKVDLVDCDRVIELKNKIREINPICRIDVSSNGNLDLSFLDEDLMQYKWAEGEETTNSPETKPKTLFMNFEGIVQREKLEKFLKEIEDDVYRVKGFFNLEDSGWNQIDVVGKQIDYKACSPQDKSQFIFISKIGPNLIKKIISAWQDCVGLKMQLKN